MGGARVDTARAGGLGIEPGAGTGGIETGIGLGRAGVGTVVRAGDPDAGSAGTGRATGASARTERGSASTAGRNWPGGNGNVVASTSMMMRSASRCTRGCAPGANASLTCPEAADTARTQAPGMAGTPRPVVRAASDGRSTSRAAPYCRIARPGPGRARMITRSDVPILSCSTSGTAAPAGAAASHAAALQYAARPSNRLNRSWPLARQ